MSCVSLYCCVDQSLGKLKPNGWGLGTCKVTSKLHNLQHFAIGENVHLCSRPTIEFFRNSSCAGNLGKFAKFAKFCQNLKSL